MNFNKVILAGNLTRDPESAVTNSGNAVVNFSIATNRYYTTQGGEKKQDTEYHDVVFFGRTAENISKYLSKGSNVLIEGRLQTRSWEDKNGNTRKNTEIIGQNVQFGNSGSKKQGKGEIDESEYAGGEIEEDDDIDVEEIDF